MNKILKQLKAASRDECGAEMIEWTLWIAGIAAIIVALLPTVQGAVSTAITTTLNALPTVPAP